MNVDGTDAVQLTSDPEIESLPSISPDGKSVVYERTDGNNKTTIWKMNVDGTDREQIVDNESRQPTFSPDGKSILFKYAPDGTGDISSLGLIATDGGKEIQQLDFPPVVSSRFFQWSSDGKAIIYLEGQTTADRLWIQPIKGGEPKEFFNTKGLRIFGFDISPANNELALALGDDRSDVVMVNNFR
jgi:Tol biopolymer transport system component